jgi:hypothetical protein
LHKLNEGKLPQEGKVVTGSLWISDLSTKSFAPAPVQEQRGDIMARAFE